MSELLWGKLSIRPNFGAAIQPRSLWRHMKLSIFVVCFKWRDNEHYSFSCHL